MKEQIYRDARTLIRTQSTGVLSTQYTIDGELYPIGSVCPFVVNARGQIAVYISDIAMHTRNIQANKNVGFTVFDTEARNKQTSWRMGLVGKAEKLSSEHPQWQETENLYFSFFPKARAYANTHDFYFHLFTPHTVHFIKTFGQIHTFPGSHLQMPTAEWNDQAGHIIDHMNGDHRDALQTYAKSVLGEIPKEVRLIHVEAEGFHLLADSRPVFLAFKEPALLKDSARKEFIRLLADCRSAPA